MKSHHRNNSKYSNKSKDKSLCNIHAKILILYYCHLPQSAYRISYTAFWKNEQHLLLMLGESISQWWKSNSASLSALAEIEEWQVSYRRGFIIKRGKYSKKEEKRGLGQRITVVKTFLSLISFQELAERNAPFFSPLLPLHLQMIMLFSGPAYLNWASKPKSRNLQYSKCKEPIFQKEEHIPQ